MPEALRLFIDAQLLISAQTTSKDANALYGAAALDLPRRGVVHLQGGMGTISTMLAEALVKNGGQMLYRHEATRIVMQRGRPVGCRNKERGFLPGRYRDRQPAGMEHRNFAWSSSAQGVYATYHADLPRAGALSCFMWGLKKDAVPDDLALTPPGDQRPTAGRGQQRISCP
jgi:hypothetical protein